MLGASIYSFKCGESRCQKLEGDKNYYQERGAADQDSHIIGRTPFGGSRFTKETVLTPEVKSHSMTSLHSFEHKQTEHVAIAHKSIPILMMFNIKGYRIG